MRANQAVQLTIQTVSGNAGVYFGNQNVSVGVSSHSKSNQAIGSLGTHNHVHHNVNIVHDPDIVDTPIDDRDIHIYAPRSSQPNLLNTRVDSITCQTITQNAGIFMGETRINGLDSHEKQNLAYGQTYGNRNLAHGNVNVMSDPDWVDALIDDRDNKAAMFVTSAIPPVLAKNV